MLRSWKFWSVMAGILALVALFAYGFTTNPRLVKSPLVGRPAPAFAITDINTGARLSLADLKGKPFILNFWASWCLECRIEHPALQGAWARFRDRGVVLVGIPFQDAPSASRAYVAEMGGDWPQAEDAGARAALDFGVTGVPETFLIGADGGVLRRWIGPVSYEPLVEAIDRALGGRAA